MRTLILLLLPLSAVAAPVRVGVVNFEKLFTETETARADRATLDSLLKQKQGDIDLRKSAIEHARQELASAARTLDGVARARREAELDADTAALKKLFTDAQDVVNRREKELADKVVADAKLIAPEVAKQRGVTLILGAAEALLWTAPSVVQVDLTAEIGRELDRRLTAR
jgi:Skp family chaperone for outer membrane proteins